MNQDSQGDTTTETWLDHTDIFWDGNGTESNPYKISTAEELAGLSYLIKQGSSSGNINSCYYKQTANIDLGGYDWYPISGATSYQFLGIYDGAGYTIEGMTIHQEAYMGLFGVLKGVIRNINLKNSAIYCSSRIAGGLAGALEASGMIENCTCDCNVYLGLSTWKDSSIGGVVGQTNGSVTIYNVKNYGNVYNLESSKDNVGGIVGYASENSTIENCYNYGIVKSIYDCVGGIVGSAQTNADITGCHNYGDVFGRNHVGGIVGWGNCANIIKDINDATIKGEIAGLIVGSMYGGNEGWSAVWECMAYGYLDVPNDSFGSLVGKAYEGSRAKVRNCGVYASSNRTVSKICGLMTGNQTIEEMSSCYSKVNKVRIYTDGDFSAWGLVNGLNNDLPMQKSLYYLAEMSTATSSQIITRLTSRGFTKVA